MVGFLWKGEREMKRQDKLSVLLMFGILCLVLVNAGAIYHMWLNGEGKLAEMKGEDPEKRSELIFHDDTSITNHGSRKLWLRVRIIYKDPSDEKQCRVDSRAIKDGIWVEENGWYYYRAPVKSKENTRPLIDRLVCGDTDLMNQGVRNFRLQAEAVDEMWLSQTPCSGQEAFQLFNDLDQKGTNLTL